MIKFKEYVLLRETRWSDAQYRNSKSPWRLTDKEYIEVSNKRGKMHSSDSYEPMERKIITGVRNPVIKVEVNDSREKGWKKICWWHKDGRGGCKDRVSPLEVSNEKDAIKYAETYSEDSDFEFKTVKKYSWEEKDYHNSGYWEKNYSKKSFPYKLETLENGVEIRYRKMPEIVIAAFIDETPVGMAFDEWGALLIQVSEKHRNKGIGKVLSRIYNSIKQKDSGGFTPQGLGMKYSIHKDAVKDALKRGWYEKAIEDGILSKEKVNEILSPYVN